MTTETAVDTIDLLILKQGYWRDLSGLTFDEFVAMDAKGYQSGPRSWRRETAVAASWRCPFAHHAFRILPDGTLQHFADNFDSSD